MPLYLGLISCFTPSTLASRYSQLAAKNQWVNKKNDLVQVPVPRFTYRGPLIRHDSCHHPGAVTLGLVEPARARAALKVQSSAQRIWRRSRASSYRQPLWRDMEGSWDSVVELSVVLDHRAESATTWFVVHCGSKIAI